METKKKGFLSKLFGAKEPSCCDMKIEEVTEDAREDDEKKEGADKKATPSKTSCCG